MFAGCFPVACVARVRVSTDSPLYRGAIPSAMGLAEQGEPSWPKDAGIWVERQDRPRRPSTMQFNWPLLRHKILHAELGG